MIKNILTLVGMLISSLYMSAQNNHYFRVNTSPSNSLYIGFNNVIEISDSVLSGYEKNMILKISNGRVAIRNNIYYLLPSKTGPVILKIYLVKGKDTTLWGQQSFQVKPVYMPVMALSGKELDSTISKSEIMKEQHFKVLLPECDYAVKFALTSCKIKFSNGRIYEASQGVIGFNIKKELSRTKTGTKICIEDIMILEFTGKERKLDNACYELVE